MSVVRVAATLPARLRQREPLLAWAGWVALALLAGCLVGVAVDPRVFNGVSVWAKPAKFAASFVIWFWSLAWAWGVLTPAARNGRVARVVVWGTLLAGGYEMGWITWRAALAQPSHYATDPLGAVAYGLMGVFAVTLVALAATLGSLVLRRGDPGQPRIWREAIGWGLVVGGVLGGLTGAAISGFGTAHVGGAGSDAGSLPPFFWARDGGDLRAAHFVGIHAMQALPLLVLLVPGVTLWGLRAAVAAWAGLTLVLFGIALAGLSVSP